MRKVVALCLLWCVMGCYQKPTPLERPSVRVVSNIQFQNVAQSAKLDFERDNGAYGKYYMPETMGGGGAFVDYDNDGYLDVLLVNGGWWDIRSDLGAKPTLTLYHNNRDGTFTNVSKEMGIGVFMAGMGVAVGDYDNDGYEDIYVTAVGRNYLFHNEQGKGFKDVSEIAGVKDAGWSTSAGWVDYDNDGKLDLFVCHYVKWTPETDIACTNKGYKSYCRPQEYKGESCRLYHNLGGGRFQDVTQKAGIFNENSKALGVTFLDIDEDGFQDILVSNDMEPNFVFRNRGNGTFQEMGFESGIAIGDSGNPRAGMGIDTTDYRDDGVFGLAIGNFSFEGVAFYPLTKAMPYQERSKQMGTYTPSYPYVTFGLFFADFDNDMWQDLFFTNGHIEDTVQKTSPEQRYEQPSVLLKNRGDGNFIEANATAGADLSQPIVGRGACAGDFDNDGKMDILLIPNKGAVRLLKNTTPNAGNWLKLRLVGTKSNRDGYGAKVMVRVGAKTLTQYCHSGSSYLSASDTRLHFGLGEATDIVGVTVRWTDGKEQIWSGLKVNETYILTEGKANPQQP